MDKRQEIIVERLRSIPDLLSDIESALLPPESVADTIASVSRGRGEQRWNRLRTLDISDWEPEQIRMELRSLPIGKSQVRIIWPFDRVGIKLPFEVFVRYYDDLWYPSADDLLILDEAGKYALEISHEEVVVLWRNSDAHRKR